MKRYYPTVLVIVQKEHERVQISHDIVSWLLYSTVCALILLHLFRIVFFQVTERS